ncbi:MAG: DNA polymerase III subunit alpha [Candidatus Kerfeldbacteria bacterium CG15_BIG_FIL_POST_REV_8_21_14_020_45_12]|uniref:DNA polymerase III subunit alpha n=1 Tax=Candidatus Kerfeldbacteria bacterium CG15_BIG_FIL_POST_REV_8_21_14_020_45_12 TaxID=2014247 RepID=A0A2M7H2F0_9BACT|nr:MAG: DNA polymerase III subunit alpha [Candidatus Kerfeldbacteria bacterium CG15_BIG_FIL_POST_REV_8_21_14_020_45_12]PJA93600.1 MAG: DNA polymerase III subunit alpha [Candidatus Kerfeldbacteria bacterium CG_4_9_14_3_um_filter_45_8]
MSFVHLHVHSHYSLLDGVPKIPELIAGAKERNMSAIALTDHGNMYGAIEFYTEAKKAGVKPIIGLEAYLSPTVMAEHDPKHRPFHLILLAKNRQGYQNLLKLTSIGNMEGFYRKPRIDKDVLRRYSDGLIGLSACLSGELARTIIAGDRAATEAAALEYVDIFGTDNFYLEVQHNPHTPEQQIVNEGLLELHRLTGIPLVATNDSHYIDPTDSEAQDVLVSIRTKALLADENRFSMRGEDYSLATSEQMRDWFQDYPGACDNTMQIADRVDIEIDLGRIQLPHFELPNNASPEDALRELCVAGIESRYGSLNPKIEKRLNYELDVISKTGYASYFLIVQDFINWAKSQGIAVGPGRGSAAGSIVAYLTNITDVDPIQYELLFERFLNPERISMPDIDTDFADVRRDDVLQYVENKYGKDRVAQIITFGTLGAKAAIRDVGRVLGFSYGYCDRISKLVPMFTSLSEAVETVPELSELIGQDSDAERLITIAKKLEGVARHTSVHACAVVITKDPLDEMLPLQMADDGSTITQYSMNPVDKLGLLKMDFLGLKNLTIIEDTLNIIQATTDQLMKIENIPLNDKRTFQLLQRAETIGVFQLESSGMRRYLKQLRPTDIEDIIAMVSLYRPGPMEFIPDYIEGKHGRRTVTYLDESLRPILEKTYGIAVYQEQIMEIARRLGGFSYGEADVLRKAVGKKNKALLDEQEQKMVQGMVHNGLEASVAKHIWEFILPFARYGFNRSHAACYAMIAYRTAYLKANYPAQFMAALLNADHDNTDRVAVEVHHAEEMGLDVLPPDINESFGMFSVVKSSLDGDQRPRIRFGLKAIKNVGDHIIDEIIAERKANGAFLSVEDMLTRVRDRDLNKKSLESLIKTGALDCFGERNFFLLNIETLLQYARTVQAEANSGQGNLLGILGSEQRPGLTLSEVPPVADKVKLAWEKELLGLYISGHPMGHLSDYLATHSIPFSELKDHPKRKPVTLIGMVTSAKPIMTRAGERMSFVGIADHTSEIEAIVFPKIYQETAMLWLEESIVKVTGKLSDKDGSMKIIIEEAERFNESSIPVVVAKVYVAVPSEMKKSLFSQFSALLAAHKGASGEVVQVFLVVDGKDIDTRSCIPKPAITDLSSLFGHDSISVI